MAADTAPTSHSRPTLVYSLSFFSFFSFLEPPPPSTGRVLDFCKFHFIPPFHPPFIFLLFLSHFAPLPWQPPAIGLCSPALSHCVPHHVHPRLCSSNLAIPRRSLE